MKKIILLLVTAFLMGGMTMAQQARRGDKTGDPKVRAERMTERMVKEYSLNDAQKQQLQEANLALMEKMGDMPMRRRQGMRPGNNDKDTCTCATPKKEGKKHQMTDEQRAKMKAERKNRHEEMETARTAYDAQLQKIMTKDQYAAYTKNMKDRQGKMEAGRKNSKRK